MARAETITFLPLDYWSKVMAINPCAFNQVVHPLGPYPQDCKATWLQHGYFDQTLLSQIDGHSDPSGMILGREDVASAIATAEQNIASALGFPVAPFYISSDQKPWPYPKQGTQISYPPINLSNGMVIAAGHEAFTAVATDRAVVYSDQDGDGVDDTATITILAAEMTAAAASYFELAVYPPSEYLDDTLYARDESWRIKPLTIHENPTTGVVTISGPRCMFVRPELWLTDDDILQDVDANFLSYVDIYRRYTDTSTQAQIVYRAGSGDNLVSCSSGAPCSESCQSACVQITHERTGEVRVIPATYSGGAYSLANFTTYPSAVRVWYLAGYYRRFNSFIEGDWMEARVARAITLLSLAYLPDAVCGCSQTRTLYERYREEQDINSLDAAMAQQYFGVVTKGSVFAASTVRLMNPLYGGGNM